MLLVSQLLAQPDFRINRDLIQSGAFFNSELHYFPLGDGYSVYYTYKIPYSQLYFEKDDDNFVSGLSVNIEVRDSLDNVVTRAFDEKNISVKDFDLTNSKTTNLQGLININLQEGKYKLLSIISDKISKRERKIPAIDLIISNSEKLLNPIMLEPNEEICDNDENYVLVNNSSSIPFNKPNDILAIPVTDSTIKSLTINVTRGDTTFISNQLNSDSFALSSRLEICNDKIIIPKSDNKTFLKYFLFSEFPAKLSEGPVRIEAIPDNELNKKKVFSFDVIWIGKPISLKDPEEAIKLISIVESKDKVKELLNSDDDQKALYSYWQKLDPTPKTNYNELMDEFYQRVDYCEITFKSIDGKGGANSDRGNIYIKYGAPDYIERNTTNDDKVIESWFYNNPVRSFVFVDNDGTGKYLLVSKK